MKNEVSENGTTERTNQLTLATVTKALDILELFSDAETDLSLTKISIAIHLPKSSVFRYLATLESRGYLERDADTEQYHIGPTIIRLGALATRRVDVGPLAETLMWQLRDMYGETVNRAILAGNKMVYVEVVESYHAIKLAAKVGADDLLHTSSLGKAVLAIMSDLQLKRLMAMPLIRLTEHTITDWPTLLRELAEVRKRGFAIDDRESDAQVICVGSAILDHNGKAVAAISISGPADRFGKARAMEAGTAVREAAQTLSRQLGYDPGRQEAR